jgi:PAS domain S-box-containing protein
VEEGIFILSVDISERKKMEEQQVLSASIINSTDDAIMSKNTDGIITSWNHGAEKTFGYSPEEIIGKHIITLIPPELQSEEVEIMAKIKRGESVDHYETQRVRKDGTVIYVSLTISPIKDSLGNVVGASKISRDTTERMKAEQDRTKAENEILKLNDELSKSEKRFRGMIEKSYDIVSITDENFQPVYRSPAAERVTGWTNEERIGSRYVETAHPDDLPKLKKVMEQVLSNPGIPFQLSYRGLHKDGHYVYLEGMVTNMLHDEAINGIIANFRDVTETRKAEQKIWESEKVYKTIASGIPGSVICLLDEDYRYFLIEGDMLDKLGYSKEQLLGKKAADVLSPERYAEVLPDFERVFRGEVFTYDRKRGNYHTLSRFVPLKNEENKVYAAMVVIIDVTELKEAERHILELNSELEHKVIERTAQLEAVNKYLQTNLLQLKESEEKFSKIFDSSPVGISISGLDTGIIHNTNKSFLQLMGFSYEEVIGHSSVELNIIREEDRENIKQEFTHTGKIRDKEIFVCNKLGENLPVLLSMDQFSIGEERYAITIIYDISKRKKAEEQMMAANKELEAFSYSVSHDLRAPLRAVNGYARIMEEDYSGILDDEGTRLLKVIKDSGNRMGLLIDDLLSFSRLGRKELKRSFINMNELVKSIVFDLNETTPHKAIIQIETLHPIMGDYSLLNHVLVNLILNAIKYSAKKERPVVTITSKRQNREVVFSISDNGVGFDMKYVHKLFGVFQRLHSSDEFPGTGVGLAIVQRIINKHGGRVWAEAKVNEGAVFSFTIPEAEKLNPPYSYDK